MFVKVWQSKIESQASSHEASTGETETGGGSGTQDWFIFIYT